MAKFVMLTGGVNAVNFEFVKTAMVDDTEFGFRVNIEMSDGKVYSENGFNTMDDAQFRLSEIFDIIKG